MATLTTITLDNLYLSPHYVKYRSISNLLFEFLNKCLYAAVFEGAS